MRPATLQRVAWVGALVLIAFLAISHWLRLAPSETAPSATKDLFALAPVTAVVVHQVETLQGAGEKEDPKVVLKPEPMKKQTPKEPSQETSSIEKANFQKLVDEVKADLPNQKDLQRLSAEQVHYVPTIVQKAALRLGDIAQAIAENSRLTEEGFQFYQECAENNNLPNSIRATCVVNHENLLKSSGSSVSSLTSDSKIDPHVISLAKRLK